MWSSNKAQKKTPANQGANARGNGKAKAKKVARALIPKFVEPELATLDTEVPTGPGWLHEVKYDGYRIIARKAGDDVTLFSRSGLDWTVRFPAIAQALQSLPSDIALIDGEVAFVLPVGHDRLQIAARAYRYAEPSDPLFRVRPAHRSTARTGARSH